MGQRHQAFLIARISTGGNPGRYKCVAAFHHQWCYGRLPLRAVRRFLTLAKQPTNAAIIREELKRIGESTAYHQNTPSLYLSNLLGCAFNIGLEEPSPQLSGGQRLEFGFLSARMGCWDFSNDDGLSIIDITDPEHGAYCFLYDRIKPMTAEAYARTYYYTKDEYLEEGENIWTEEDDLTEQDLVSVINSLAGIPLINMEALAETWRGVFRWAPTATTQDTPGEVPALAKDPISRFVPSLADLALLPSIKYALSKNDIGPIEDILWMPGKVDAILDIFKSPEFDPLPDAALPLLAKALGQSSNKREMDISRFPLADDQILHVISERKGLHVLNISHNRNVTITTIHAVLSTVPELRRLVLLGTDITEEDWADLLIRYPNLFYRLESLIHPCFYQAEEAFYPSAFTFIWASGSDRESAALPFFTPALIVEALSQIFVSQCFQGNIWFHQSEIISSAAGAVVLSHEVLSPNQSWGERAIPFFAPPVGESVNDGWTFFMVQQKFSQVNIGFVRHEGLVKDSVNPSEEDDEEMEKKDIVIKTFDFTGFILELEREGRPKAPEYAVKTLTEALTKLTNHSEPGRTRYQWLTQEGAQELFEEFY